MDARETAKFGLLVGLCGIFIDAVIAHGLFWDNDPYWTYWITKTFLITTVFVLGTAWIGAGLWQGLVITAVHTLILEVYYQWLAPVGLPQEPEWLDFNHLWVTGLPVHYLAILIGYLMALWIWRRNAPLRAARAIVGDTISAGRTALGALAVVAGVLLVSGVLTHGLLLRNFPGLTYFVQHLLVGFVFVYFWTVFVGTGRAGWAVGGLMLALVWTAYGLYLGPEGLPNHAPHYLGYDDLWLRAFPGDLVSALLVFWLADHRRAAKGLPRTPLLALLLSIGLVAAPAPAQAGAMPGSATAQGSGMLVVGPDPVDFKSTVPLSGRIDVRVVEGGNRWSHVQNTDQVDVTADFEANGLRWNVVIDRPVPRHPHGRYTTWNGVVFDHAMHGDTGIGTPKLPKMKPDISLYGWATVRRDGQVISPRAFAHVMVTTKEPMRGVMLEVETEDKALVGAPDGYLTAMWHDVGSLSKPDDEKRRREILGWIALFALAAGFAWLASREKPVQG
jgi:hypothetical protein